MTKSYEKHSPRALDGSWKGSSVELGSKTGSGTKPKESETPLKSPRRKTLGSSSLRNNNGEKPPVAVPLAAVPHYEDTDGYESLRYVVPHMRKVQLQREAEQRRDLEEARLAKI